MVFDNATSVFINGEEVESIIFEGGGVLYQKEINGEPLVVSQLELNKTGGKQILSHADYSVSDNTEYCTLTATALDSNNRGVSGESIVFKNGNTVLDTITTDSNGHASYTYVSQGNGEVKISAECTVEGTLLFEEYFIHDYYAYDSLTSDSGHWTSNDNKANTSYSDSGLDIYFTSGSSMHYYNNDISLPSSFVLEVTVPTSSTITGSYFNVMGISLISNSSVWRVGKSDVGIVYTSDIAPANNDVLKWEYDGINMKTYVNGTLLSSQTPNKSGLWIECGDSSTNHKYYKDMKIKPLVPIILSVSKKILSYVDYDDITITATLTNQNNTNIPITFNAIDSNNNIIDWGSDTTDSSGIATYTYYSQGAGDVIITAECGSFIQTYNIEDCTYYNSGSISSKQSLSIPNIPSNFQCSFKVKRASSSNASYLEIGGNSNSCLYIGQLGTNGGNGVWVHTSDNVQHMASHDLSIGVETLITFEYDNGDITYTNETDTVSFSDSTIISRSYVYANITNNYMKELKIKPLDSLSLTSDVSVLSYADSDSATFTATYSKGSGYDVKLYNADTDALIGTMTDTNDGTYSYTYNSQGIGDLEVYAKSGSLQSEIYEVHDRYFYDACTDNTKLTHYGSPIKVYGSGSVTGALTYDSTQNAHKVNITSSNTGERAVFPIDVLDDVANYRIKFKYKHGSTQIQNQDGFNMVDTSVSKATGVLHWGNGDIKYGTDISGGTTTSLASYSTGITTNYFIMICEKQGKTLSVEVQTSDGTTIATGSGTSANNPNKGGFAIYPYDKTRYYFVKDVEIDIL